MGSDLGASAARIAADVEALTGERYTLSGPGITRYAYTDVYAATLDYFRAAFEAIGFAVWSDPVGTLVASNVAPGERAFGMGSHCDSNRNGGRWDGTLGVVSALEACRIAGDSLPLRVIAFLEEEASGFGQMLLGSRIVLGTVSDEELASYRDEHGVPFLEAAAQAGYRPDERARAGEVLDGLVGWIELHIEQGRVLQDTGARLGVVDAIAGYVHADVTVRGRADHAGATPMDFRSDAGLTAAEVVVALERIVRSHSPDTVGTVGALTLHPGIIKPSTSGRCPATTTRSTPPWAPTWSAGPTPAGWPSIGACATACPRPRWTRTSSRRSSAPPRSAARPGAACRPAPPTTPRWSPAACPRRCSSSPAATASATRPRNRPTPPTPPSASRSCSPRPASCWPISNCYSP